MIPLNARPRALMFAVSVVVLSSVSAQAEQAPFKDCRPVSKIEYDSAKQQYLLRQRFGFYVRTGSIWRRQFWYCR
jgi:hypothetical protein